MDHGNYWKCDSGLVEDDRKRNRVTGRRAATSAQALFRDVHRPSCALEWFTSTSMRRKGENITVLDIKQYLSANTRWGDLHH